MAKVVYLCETCFDENNGQGYTEDFRALRISANGRQVCRRHVLQGEVWDEMPKPARAPVDMPGGYGDGPVEIRGRQGVAILAAAFARVLADHYEVLNTRLFEGSSKDLADAWRLAQWLHRNVLRDEQREDFYALTQIDFDGPPELLDAP